MSGPHFHPPHRTLSTSIVLEKLGDSLKAIKDADELTFADLGAPLGKTQDRAGAYTAGASDMGVVSFIRGCGYWGDRFANDALALVGLRVAPIGAGEGTDHQAMSALCALAGRLAQALEDGSVTDDELDGMWPDVECVWRHFDRLRRRRTAALVAAPP